MSQHAFPKGPLERPERRSIAHQHQYFRWMFGVQSQCYCVVMQTCDKCRGTMVPERAVDLDAGLAITVYACLNCGRRKMVDPEPRPLTSRR